MIDTIGVEEFRAWLTTRKKQSVGASCVYGTCPLATFFKERLGVIVLVHSTYAKMPDDSRVRLLEWQSDFVRDLDRRYKDMRSVNGREALEVLDSGGIHEQQS